MQSAILQLWLSILSRPIIRDILSMGREAVFIGCVVSIDLCRDVDDDRLLLANALPSMIDPIGHLDQHRVMDTDEEFVDLPFRRRTLPRIVKDQFDHPLHGND